MTATLPLGRDVAYPQRYDPSLLFPIPRAAGREPLGLAGTALPFVGHDRWHAYELGWLDGRGKPVVATATLVVPAESPCLVESKSLKLYLNSLNAERFDALAEVRARIVADLSTVAGAPVGVDFGLPPFDDAAADRYRLDELEVDIDAYGPPDATQLVVAAGDEVVDEVLRSRLLKSNCPVTGQPDWASLHVGYRGPRIDAAGLLRYIVSYRQHAGFHEQCVEQIFVDVLARCRPTELAVEARYTRRGGLDINPVRTTPEWPAWEPRRDERQ